MTDIVNVTEDAEVVIVNALDSDAVVLLSPDDIEIISVGDVGPPGPPGPQGPDGATVPHTHVIIDVVGLPAALDAKQALAYKGIANGYAGLGADGKVPVAQLPAAGTPTVIDDSILPQHLDADDSAKQLLFRDRLNYVSRAGDVITGGLVVQGSVTCSYAALKDTSANYVLSLLANEAQTADRALLIKVGDANRLLTLSGNPTLADWFDQSVKTTAAVAFGSLAANNFVTCTYCGLKETTGDFTLNLFCGDNLTANKGLTFIVGDATRTLTLSGNPTIGDWFDQSVKSTASPTFGGLTLNGNVTGSVIADGPLKGQYVSVMEQSGVGPSNLNIFCGDNLTTDRGLTFNVGDASRTVTLNGHPTLADWFDQSVKAAASPTFNNLTLTGGIVGTTAADSAAAGHVGAYVSSTILAGAAVALTSNTITNVTSISLTAGDWDVWGSIFTNPAASTTQTLFVGAINTASAAFPSMPGDGAYVRIGNTGFAASTTIGMPIGFRRISIAATTTVYLVTQITFGTSTNAAYGFLGARRVR